MKEMQMDAVEVLLFLLTKFTFFFTKRLMKVKALNKQENTMFFFVLQGNHITPLLNRKKYLSVSNFTVVTTHCSDTTSHHPHHRISVKTQKVSAHVRREAAYERCIFMIR
jgi:hypothetical protein